MPEDIEAIKNDLAETKTTMKAILDKLKEPTLPASTGIPNIATEPAEPRAKDGPYAQFGTKGLGMQLRDVVICAKAADGGYEGDTTESRNRLKANNVHLKALGMNEGTLADGGAMVQTEYSNVLIERTYEIGRVLSQVQEQPVGAGFNAYSALVIDETSRANGSRYGGVQFYRLPEGGTKLPSRPKLRRLEVKAEKIAAVIYLTDELIEDAAALQGHVQRIYPQEAAFVLENELFNGQGGGESLGVLNAPATVSVAKETGQTAATFTYNNALAMMARMWAPSFARASWYVDQSVLPQIYNMTVVVGTGGAPVFLPPSGASGTPYGTLFGRPIVPVEYTAALGTVGDVVLADFSQYLGVSKGGLKEDSSMHVAFLTDETVLRFVQRYKAMPLWNAALTPRSGGSTLSPYITLATRA